MAEFAEKQVSSWETLPGHEVPTSAIALADAHPGIDGRLVTDLDKLPNPAEKPNLQHAGTAAHTSPVRARELFDPAILEKKQACLSGMPCFSLAECFLWNCFACFYANSPPLGACFPD